MNIRNLEIRIFFAERVGVWSWHWGVYDIAGMLFHGEAASANEALSLAMNSYLLAAFKK